MREGRRYERVPFVCDGTLRSSTVGAPVSVTTTDLSEGGLGVYSSRYLERGSIVRVSVSLEVDGKPTQIETVEATVRFCEVDVDGNRLGLEFTRALTQQRNPLIWERLQSALRRATRFGV